MKFEKFKINSINDGLENKKAVYINIVIKLEGKPEKKVTISGTQANLESTVGYFQSLNKKNIDSLLENHQFALDIKEDELGNYKTGMGFAHLILEQLGHKSHTQENFCVTAASDGSSIYTSQNHAIEPLQVLQQFVKAYFAYEKRMRTWSRCELHGLLPAHFKPVAKIEDPEITQSFANIISRLTQQTNTPWHAFKAESDYCATSKDLTKENAVKLASIVNDHFELKDKDEIASIRQQKDSSNYTLILPFLNHKIKGKEEIGSDYESLAEAVKGVKLTP